MTTSHVEADAAPTTSLLSRTSKLRPSAVAAVVTVIGIVFTCAGAWVAWTLNARSERNLLEIQTKQAAAVLSGSILSITNPLTTALRVSQATGGDGELFRSTLAPSVGPEQVFVSATLWDTASSPARAVASLGVAPEMTPGSAESSAFIERARTAPTFVITNPGGGLDRVAYAVSDPAQSRYVVYAERAIPASRVVPVQRSAAFSGLTFATYIGRELDSSTLATTNIAESELPLTGVTATEEIPFGDTTLTLVTRAEGHIGGDLGWQLPWLFLCGGALLTAVTAMSVANLVRSRRRAEQDRRTIAELYERLDEQYGEQRGIALTLQSALLPAFNPDIPELEIASRYVAGAVGVDIGGDWYSMIPLDVDHMAFVVGDVSGRGISAATAMARLRFTIRAYLAEGHGPATVLDMCSRQFDISDDGHFATVLVGVVNLRTRTVVLANAGHFAPLILSGEGRDFAATDPSPPLGTGVRAHTATTFTMPEASTLLAFTDGLIERRNESLDVGLGRLAAMTWDDQRSVDDLLEHVVTDLADGPAEDDIALLAFRWRPLPDTHAQERPST